MDKKDKIKLLIIGYEWKCPVCQALNTEAGSVEFKHVICMGCGKIYEVEEQPPYKE